MLGQVSFSIHLEVGLENGRNDLYYTDVSIRAHATQKPPS